jgi:hypothetical protein
MKDGQGIEETMSPRHNKILERERIKDGFFLGLFGGGLKIRCVA